MSRGPYSLAVLLALSVSPCAFGYGVENNAGLRRAEFVSPTRIRLLSGPGFSDWQFEKKFFVYQVVSATDAAFQRGVGAKSVKIVATEPDGVYPEGWAGPRFAKYTLEVDLPDDRPMQDGHRYWLRINSSGVMAFNRRSSWVVRGNDLTGDIAPRYGIRETYALSPKAIHVITGAGLDVARLADPANVAVTSVDDPDFREPVHPEGIGRRSNLDFYVGRGWPWEFHQRHELFLLLPKPMKNGSTYTVNLNAKAGAPVTCGKAEVSLKLDDRETLNLAIKVNQCGYLPEAREKYAYLGMWMGDLNAYDFAPFAKTFEARDAKTHRVALAGEVKLRRKATYKLTDGKLAPDPTEVKSPETMYKMDLSYEDVYQLDLSPLKEPGRYYVAIPGMGRSFAFRIGEDAYAEAWKIAMNGLFHQRCGIELKEPWTKHYRPACHRGTTEYSTAPSTTPAPSRDLVKFATDGKKHDLWGGHHDAGDHPKSHLYVAQALFLLYDMNQAAFKDGQLSIPENGNGIPDILDEAWWALDLWNRLQDADGGVHAWVETAGDPNEGEAEENDTLREFAYRKEAGASYWYAAIAAQASIIWKELGHEGQGGELLQRAVRAWDWAQANPDKEEALKQKECDYLVFAAAMLLRATGEKKYEEAFKQHSIIVKDASQPLSVYNKYDQVFGSYYYARLAAADPELKARIVAAFEREFEEWAKWAETTTYRYMRSPGAPNTWGTGGLPYHLVRPAMTMHLTAGPDIKAKARQWIEWTCDFSLGCHPLNLVFTVGLGQRYVTSGKHILLENSPEGIIPGLQSEGAGSHHRIGGAQPGPGGMGKWPAMSMYPAGQWPDLYFYSDWASPGMNEGVTPTQAATALAYGLLLPAAQK
jgi:hypothetical protein